MRSGPHPVSKAQIYHKLLIPQAPEKKGRSRKTWSECARTDVDKCGIAGVDPLDRGAPYNLVLSTPENGTRTAPLSKYG